MQTILRLDRLGKTFRDFWLRPRVRAVDDLSLEVHAGEVLDQDSEAPPRWRSPWRAASSRT